MFTIKYNFSDDDSVEEVFTDGQSVRYNLFPGNLLFEKDHDSFVMDCNGMPVIDFAFRILQISNSLFPKNQERKEFEFTETNERIAFEKDGDKVRIIPSFSSRILEMNIEDFKKGIVQFHKNVILDALRKNQSLKINALLDQYSYKAEEI
jgi:hypothetical protein